MKPIRNPGTLTALGLPADATEPEFEAAWQANDLQTMHRNGAAIAEALIRLAMRQRSIERPDAIAFCLERYPLLRAEFGGKPALGNSAKQLVGLANELFSTGGYATFEDAYGAAKNRRPDLAQKVAAASARPKSFTANAERNLLALANEKVAQGQFTNTADALAHVKALQG